MQLSFDERRSHLDLNLKCIERGGHSTKFQGILAVYLNTSIPSNNRNIKKETRGLGVERCALDFQSREDRSVTGSPLQLFKENKSCYLVVQFPKLNL